MFAREKRPSQQSAESSPRRAAALPEVGALRMPMLQRKVCACGGGCPRCAAKAKQTGGPNQGSLAASAGHAHSLEKQNANLETHRAESIQTKLEVGNVDDPLEYEADRVADQIVSNGDHDAVKSGPLSIQRFNGGSAGHGDAAPESVREVLAGVGRPLEQTVRSDMERRSGYDFSRVRVHTGALAEKSAEDVSAYAYTAGNDIVFAANRYAPGTSEGRRLIAHELVHTVQQSAAGRKAIMRQPSSKPIDCTVPEPEELRSKVENGDTRELTITPGPLRSGLLGSHIFLPSYLHLEGDSADLGVARRLEAILSPKLLVGGLIENIDLETSPRSGFPPDQKADDSNQSKITLVDPILNFDPSKGRLRGRATLTIGGDYPSSLKDATDVDVEIESTEIGQFSGKLGYGPAVADFTLKLQYDSGRLERALKQGFNVEGDASRYKDALLQILTDSVPGLDLTSVSAGVESALRSLLLGKVNAGEFAERAYDLIKASVPRGADLKCLKRMLAKFASELTHPGFKLRSGLHLGGLRVSSFEASAPTTEKLDHPLLGAPADFPISARGVGVIAAPPGAIASFVTPALGYQRLSFDEKSGTSLTIATLPTLSTSAISAGQSPLAEFPLVAYAEISHVSRVSKHLEIGVRATVSLSSALLAGSSATSQNFSQQIIGLHNDVQSTLAPGYAPYDLLSPSTSAPADSRATVRDLHDPTAADSLPRGVDSGAQTPLIGVSIFGRWGS